MKSVGERIRQARNARKMSGEELAARVGYKNQSAIGNLESRAGGSGGNRIGQIADALSVPVDWLLRGPDGDEVPYAPREKDSFSIDSPVATNKSALEASQITKYLSDPIFKEAAALISKMSVVGREQAILYLRFLATQHTISQHSAGGDRDSLPYQKAV